MSLQLTSQKDGKLPLNLLVERANDLKRVWQRRHELLILSCYMDIKVVRQLIRRLAKKVRLVRVRFSFDAGEAVRGGIEKTERALAQMACWCEEREIIFEPAVLMAPRLLHAKGFALIQHFSEGVSGYVFVGSANITGPGFAEGSNIELGFLTSERRHILKFEGIFEKLVNDCKKDLTAALLRENVRLFRFGLLDAGIFISPWNENLRQLVGIRYQIKDVKKLTQLPEKLRAEGFELSDSLTHQVLNVESLPPLHSGISKRFSKSFFVRTSIGKWCPKVIWKEVPGGDFPAFQKAFQEMASDEALDNAITKAKEWREDLVREGIIKDVKPEFFEKWKSRVIDLRNSESRLKRIYYKCDEFEFPYGSHQTDRIDEVFSSLQDSLDHMTQSSWLKRKLVKGLKKRSLSPLKIDEKARKVLDAAFPEIKDTAG